MEKSNWTTIPVGSRLVRVGELHGERWLIIRPRDNNAPVEPRYGMGVYGLVDEDLDKLIEALQAMKRGH